MKRIPQKFAVETLSFFLSGNQVLKIIDKEHMYDTGKEVFFGTLNDLKTGYTYVKQLRSEIHSIEVTDNVLVIEIRTKYEEY